jgi:phosphoribosyl 1,2-cyclic phosphodiesterase
LLQFASLGSGSKGNATLVRCGDTLLLLDCGFSLRETEARLRKFELTPENITAVLVTHEHSDHISGVGALARRYDLPVYMTHGTWKSGKTGKLEKLVCINPGDDLAFGEVEVLCVPVPHDAREPVQFIFRYRQQQLGVLTDLGSLSQKVISEYRDCSALVLESNHCPEMLENGPYHAALKSRISGDWGHLSNHQAAAMLDQMKVDLKHLVIAHLSEQNNSVARAEKALEHHLKIAENSLFACQQAGFGWLDL